MAEWTALNPKETETGNGGGGAMKHRTRGRAGVAVGILLAGIVFAPIWGNAQAKPAAQASVERGAFGKLEDGTVIELFTLKNSRGAVAKVITYGATLTEL